MNGTLSATSLSSPMVVLTSSEGVVLLCLVLYAAFVAQRYWNSSTNAKSSKARQVSTKSSAKPAPSATTFMPAPQPDLTLTPSSISTRIARDHVYANKTIRYPYHQTMAHQPMLPENWIEPDQNYISDLAFKQEVIQRQGKVVLDTVDDENVSLGCQELMVHLTSWLMQRYPDAFRWKTGQQGKVIENLLLQPAEKVQLLDDRGSLKSGTEALMVVSRLVQDDFLLAAPSPKKDGSWYCCGGLVAFPGFYLLSEKIGKSLFDVHSPVPHFNSKLLTSVERSLTRLSPDGPIERTSWEIVDHEFDLFWAPMAGPLPTGSGARPFLPHHSTGRAGGEQDPSKLILRLDHQTFTKMPKSGIVAFGVHPMRRTLEQLKDQKLLPKLLIKIHQESDPELMTYKAAPLYQDKVLPYLQSLHQSQVERGLITEEDRVQDFRNYT